jgi:hypothetical protein
MRDSSQRSILLSYPLPDGLPEYACLRNRPHEDQVHVGSTPPRDASNLHRVTLQKDIIDGQRREHVVADHFVCGRANDSTTYSSFMPAARSPAGKGGPNRALVGATGFRAMASEGCEPSGSQRGLRDIEVAAHTRIESTVRYLGIEICDAIEIAERIDVSEVSGQSCRAVPRVGEDQMRTFAALE